MSKYTLSVLRRHVTTGEIQIEVRHKGFGIQKRLAENTPITEKQYLALNSGNKMLINNEVEKLGNELLSSLKKSGHINEQGEVMNSEWVDLIPE